MKLHLPKLLRTALMGLAASAAPFALTLATASSVIALSGVAQAYTTEESVELSGSQKNVGANSLYNTVTVTGTEISTIAFTPTNTNLAIGALSIAEGAALTINANICDVVLINGISGSGDLTLNRTGSSASWGYSVALFGDNSGYAGRITTINANGGSNSMQLYLMSENAAKDAEISLGGHTTLGVSTGTAKIAGLSGTAADAAVISFANPNATQSTANLDTNSGNSYNQNTARETNDATARTLVLTGDGEYSYAGRMGSSDNNNKLNLTVNMAEGGKQTLSGTNYLNTLTVTSGELVLSGTTTLAGRASGDFTVQDGSLTLNGSGSNTASFGHVKVLQGGTLELTQTDQTGYNNHGSASIYLKGEGDALATLQLNARQTTSIDITLAGSSRIESNVTDGAVLDMFGGTINASGSDNEINAIIATRKDAVYNVAENGSLTINGSFVTRVTGEGNGLVSKTGAGTLTLTSAENVFRGGISVSEGELVLAEGSVSTIASGKALSIAEGATLTVAGTLNLVGVTLDNSGVMAMQEGAVIDFGITEGTITVGTMTGFSQEMLYGLGGRKTASYADGVITISGTVGDLIWNGTAESHVWNSDKSNTVWSLDNGATSFEDRDGVTFGTLTEGVSSHVTIAETVTVTSITVNDAYTFEVNADNTFATIDGEGTVTKTGAATLTLEQIPAAKVAVSEGKVTLSSQLGGTADASGIRVAENGTLEVNLAEGAYGTQLTLDAESSGTVEVLQGMLRVDNDNRSSVGTGAIVLNDGTGLTFASSAVALSEVGNDIEIKDGTVEFKTFGNATKSSDNRLTGTITGSGTINKTDGGKLTLSGDMSGFSGSVSMGATEGNRLIIDTNATISGLTMNNNTHLTVSGEHTLTIGTRAEDLNNMGTGVTISSNDQTRSLTVESGSTLTDNRYLLLNGGTLNIDGGGTMELFGISLSSAGSHATIVNIAADTTVHIFGTSHSTAHGNEAAFSLSHWGAANRLNVSGTLISDAAIVSVSATTASLDVKEGGKLVMTNGLRGYHRDSGAVSVINVEAGGTLSVGSEEENSTGVLTVNMEAGSTIEAYAADSIVGQTLSLGSGEGAVNFRADEGKTLTLKSISGDLDMAVVGGGTVALDTMTLANNVISVAEGSTLSLMGEVTVSKTITSDGTVVCGENGQLTLADTTGLEVVGSASSARYSDAVSSSTVNGYAHASYVVIRGGQVENLDSVMLNGETYALEEIAGNRVISFSGNGGAYYVNEGTVVYGDAGNSAASESTTSIVLNGGSLAMQQNLAESVGITLSADSTLSLDAADVTLNKDSVTLNEHVLTLNGNGTYVVANADLAHADSVSLADYTGVTLGDDWTGTVKFDGGTFWGANMGSITQGSIELSGVTGMFARGTSECTAKLILTDLEDGTAAVRINNGWGGDSVTFSGEVSGSGKLERSVKGGSGKTFTFSGDISEWSGGFDSSFSAALEYYTTIVFSGEATTINAFVTSTGDSKVNVTVNNDADVTVNGEIEIAATTADRNGTLTLQGNGTKTFTNTVAAGSVNAGGGDVTFTEALTIHAASSFDANVTASTLTLSDAGAVTLAGGKNLTLTGENELAYDKVTLNTGATITIGENGSLTSDGIVYAHGATLTRGDSEGNLSAWSGGYSVTGGDIIINAGEGQTSDRNISMVINGGNVTSHVGGTLTLTHAAVMDSFTGGTTTFSGDVTINGDATINGAASFEGGSTIGGNATFAGLTSINAGLTVNGDTTLTGDAASVGIADGVTFITGNETITNLQEGTAATISGTGLVSVENEGITYTGADITVNTADTLNTAATLSNSRLTVTGGGSASAEVEEGSVNSFVATEGDVSVNTGSAGTAQVENLTVGGGKDVSFIDNGGNAATVVISGTADVAGSISADVRVESGSTETPATFTAQEGAVVSGNLTVTDSGKLVLSSVVASGGDTSDVLSVASTLTATATTISLSEGVADTINAAVANLSAENAGVSFVLAKAANFAIAGWTIDGTTLLTAEQLASLGLSAAENVSFTLSAETISTFAMRSSTSSDLTLTATYTATPVDPVDPTDLVATIAATSFSDGVLSISVQNADSDILAAGNFNVTVGPEAWKSIVEAMDGKIYQNAFVKLVDIDGAELADLRTLAGVTLNGYVGTGTQGEFFVAYIPEPATATLSLLALAALAARRRRK